MSLKDTAKHMKTLLQGVASDLEKADNGNKAAAQRVRTGTIRLEKVAKLYRKESIKTEKTGGFKKKPKAAAKKAAPKKAAPKAAPKSAKPAAKKAPAAPKKAAKSRAPAKRPTAKIVKKKK